MRVFVTGGSGFLGRALMERLQAASHYVVAPGSSLVNLQNQGSLKDFESDHYDLIFHLAAWTRAGDFCRRHGGEQWIVNNQINTNVLAWWQKSQPQAKLVALGTSVSYINEDAMSEDLYMDGNPKPDYYAYAMSKRMLWAGMTELGRQFGLRYLYLVPSTLYGPGYPTDGRPLHFIYDLIHKILRGHLFGEPVMLWGDGHQRRELVFIDDFVQAATKLADNPNNLIVNIGAGEDYSIRQFAQLICDFAGFDFSRIQFDVNQFVGARSKVLDTHLLNTLLPDFKRTPLAEGIRQTIAWMRTEPFYMGRSAHDSA